MTPGGAGGAGGLGGPGRVGGGGGLGGLEAAELAAVLAALGRRGAPAPGAGEVPPGLAAWRRTRLAALGQGRSLRRTGGNGRRDE